MSVVVDNSMALAWALPDEGSAFADAVLDQVIGLGGHVPFIFPAEFANGLVTATRRGRIGREARADALAFMKDLKLVRHPSDEDLMGAIVDLAESYRLAIYDALYLDLALRLSLPLATLDRKLAAAAQQAGVSFAAQ